MRVEIDVPKEALVNAIVSGVEGGIRYWARVTQYHPEMLEVTVEELEPYARTDNQPERLSYRIDGGVLLAMGER